ncbi:hypothetical protein [Luteimonas salinilitoris]|uniref:Uncharacterized protein n=1 Tax=Luteimonas salinilitoris TaxID=3237697 RepID=A0ABV4HQ53_9GAMM
MDPLIAASAGPWTLAARDYDPAGKEGGFSGDAAAQWRAILANIKSDLEELGTALDHLIRLTQLDIVVEIVAVAALPD